MCFKVSFAAVVGILLVTARTALCSSPLFLTVFQEHSSQINNIF